MIEFDLLNYEKMKHKNNISPYFTFLILFFGRNLIKYNEMILNEFISN